MPNMNIPKFKEASDDLFVYAQAGGVAQTGATTMAQIQEFMRNNSDVLKCLVQALWQPQVQYAVNQVIWSPNMPKNMLAIVTTAGTTNGNEPVWPSVAEQTVQDGTVVFEMRKQVYSSSDFFNVDMVYPVGSIYMSTASTNPGTLFPGTTWEAYAQGRVLIGAGTGKDSRNESKTFTAGSTGGEYNHQLTVGEIPAHSHAAITNSAGAHTHGLASSDGWGGTKSVAYSNDNREFTGTTDSNGNHTHSITVNNTGNNEAHLNMQPYITCYIWQRTA